MGKKHEAVVGEIVTAAGPWREALLVCRKCGTKMKKGGFGPDGRDTLPQALKQALRDRRLRREVRVLEVGCLGICPKDAVAVIRGGTPGEMLLVPRGVDVSALVETKPGVMAGTAPERTGPGGVPPGGVQGQSP